MAQKIPVLELAGLGVRGGGAPSVWQRHEAAIGERLRGLLPTALRGLLR